MSDIDDDLPEPQAGSLAMTMTDEQAAYKLGQLEGAAVAFGVIGMAQAIRRWHLSNAMYGYDSCWICPHDPKCNSMGYDCGPDCCCGSPTE